MRGMIDWVVKNPTLVNLIMAGICILGIVSIDLLPKEVFPSSSLDLIFVRTTYRGAGPAEIENGVLIKIEEAVQGISGISQVSSEARENLGIVRIEVASGAKTAKVLRDVKDQIDQILTFPKDADKPTVFEVVRRLPVAMLSLNGKVSRAELQTIAERVKDEMLRRKGIEFVDIKGSKVREISIEVSESRLRKYGLQVADIGRALALTNFDLSGGLLRTRREDYIVRMYGKKYKAKDLENIVVKTLPGGNHIRIRDIAKTRETFEDTPNETYFNGNPALILQVQRSETGNALKIIKEVKTFLVDAKKILPKRVALEMYRDTTIPLRDRISLLVKNGLQGLVLVLLTLSLLMNLRLAFWVALGLPVSMLGTFILMLPTNITVNVLSLFGLILVIGILVDDAIVVAENVYSHLENGKSPLKAAVDGTVEVLPAVFAAVFTTILAFCPMFFMGGLIGKFIFAIPAVVCLALLLSLVEGFMILPPHLAHSLKPMNGDHKVNRFRAALNKGFEWLNNRHYAGLLRFALNNRWAVMALGIAMFLTTIGLIGGGVVKFVFFPRLDADQIAARFVMKPGTPRSRTKAIALRMEKAGLEVSREFKKKYGITVVVNRTRYIGSTTLRTPGFSPPSGEEVGEVQLELLPSQKRKISSYVIINAWRKKVGRIAGALRVSYDTVGGPPFGKALEFQLLSNDSKQLRTAATALRKKLTTFSGAYDAEDDLTLGKKELRMRLTPLARSLGMTLQELALQIRYRITGQEVMRLQRGRDEVRVYVRYPKANRKSLRNLDELWIRTRRGKDIPLAKLATWKYTRDLDVIRRISRQRIATVSASFDNSKGSSQSVMRELNTKVFPKLFKENPDVRLIMSGQAREQGKVFGGMKVAFPLALFAIFVILVAVFRSYSQAFLILSMVPFGLIGAVLGHMLLGYPLTILSFFGIVGLSGMVVNDSLVLMDKLNRLVLDGYKPEEAAWLAGQARLRAILSTTLTTFAGLAPLLLEKSMQAQFLIPMAISIGFGIVFATFITLVMVPSFYLIVNDIRCFFHWLLKGRWPSYEEIEPISKLRREREELAELERRGEA